LCIRARNIDRIEPCSKLVALSDIAWLRFCLRALDQFYSAVDTRVYDLGTAAIPSISIIMSVWAKPTTRITERGGGLSLPKWRAEISFNTS
jgi:hypothetical protein